MRLNSVIPLLASIVALTQPFEVIAQEQEARALEEIIVTAQKREERLVEVPMIVNVVGGEQLEEGGYTNIQDLALAVPGISTREDGPGTFTVFMRGLSNQYGSGPLVSVFVDEAPISLTAFDQMDVRYIDMERVEVLKGPQGTLFGQGSVGGSVRYITRAPVLDRVEGEIKASVADVSEGNTRKTVTGVINMPLATDRFALRIAATAEDGGGWQDHPAAGIKNGNAQDVVHARARALWRLNDKFDVDMMVLVHRNEARLGQGYENADRTIFMPIDPTQVLPPKIFDYDLYSLNLKYDFGAFELLSASSYVDNFHQSNRNYQGWRTVHQGGIEGDGFAKRWVKQFAQELRLVSTGEGPLQWTVGAFYRDTSKDFYRESRDKLLSGAYFPALSLPRLIFNLNDTYESYSYFADVSFDFTSRLTAGAGVRYFTEDQTSCNCQNYPTDPAQTYSEGESFDSVDPRVYASFKVTDDTSIYASVATGFRSGGFNGGIVNPNYEPESLINYEIGAKGTVSDGKVYFDIAAFFSDYDDMMRRGLVFEECCGFISNNDNIGKVEVRGVEGGLTLHPTNQLTLHATATYMDSEIKKINVARLTQNPNGSWNATNFAGDPVDYVPQLSVALGARFDFNWGADVPGFVRIDYNHRDEFTYIDRTSFANASVPQQSDALDLVDARIGLELNRMSIELFGTNLTNQNRWLDPYHGWRNANRTRPRTVGLEVGYRFD